MATDPAAKGDGDEDCDDEEEGAASQLMYAPFPQPSSAPMPQYPPVPQFHRGQLTLPGQGSLNPCCCCSALCNGTCTLLIGCIVISSVFIALGSVYVATSSSSLVKPLSRILPKILNQAAGNKGRQAENGTNYNDQYLIALELEEDAVINTAKHIEIVVFAEGAFFLLFPGILLFIACFKLSKPLCMMFAIMVGLGILYDIGGSIYLTVKVEELKLKVTPTDKRDEVKLAAILYIWISTVVEMLWKGYAITCSFGLFRQIGNGEYNTMPMPYLPTPGFPPLPPPPYGGSPGVPQFQGRAFGQ